MVAKSLAMARGIGELELQKKNYDWLFDGDEEAEEQNEINNIESAKRMTGSVQTSQNTMKSTPVLNNATKMQYTENFADTL